MKIRLIMLGKTRREEARDAYQRAIALVTNQVERNYLTRRLRETS